MFIYATSYWENKNLKAKFKDIRKVVKTDPTTQSDFDLFSTYNWGTLGHCFYRKQVPANGGTMSY